MDFQNPPTHTEILKLLPNNFFFLQFLEKLSVLQFYTLWVFLVSNNNTCDVPASTADCEMKSFGVLVLKKK